MKISDCKDIFGPEFGLLLTRKKNGPIAESDLAQNIYKIPVHETRDTVIATYISILQTQIEAPTSKYFSLADRLICDLSLHAKRNNDTNTQQELKKIIKILQSMRLLSTQFVMMKLDIGQAKINRTIDFGCYPQATVPFSELHLQNEQTALSFYKTLREEYQKTIDYSELLIFNKQFKQTYRSYPFNRIGTLDASLITIDKSIQFILSACPGKSQIDEHFQKAILDSNCSLWFTLNTLTEKTFCPKFWSNTYLKNLNNVKIINKDENDYRDNLTPKLFESQLIATKDESYTTITHLHYDCWVDGEEAPDDALLLKCAQKACQEIQKGKKVGINCMGGVGRSGTLAVLTACLVLIHKQVDQGIPISKISINIPEIIFKFRLQRTSIVGSSEQFMQIYRVLGQYYNELIEK